MEVHQALQAAMDKLQQRFTSLMQEKVDLKERVEELEHRCIQLSGETDTIGEAAVVLRRSYVVALQTVNCQVNASISMAFFQGSTLPCTRASVLS